jgi:hypothetical protein
MQRLAGFLVIIWLATSATALAQTSATTTRGAVKGDIGLRYTW